MKKTTKTAKVIEHCYGNNGETYDECGTVSLVDTQTNRLIDTHGYCHAAERTYTLTLITNLAAARGYTIVG